jgi:hypothetical protein
MQPVYKLRGSTAATADTGSYAFGVQLANDEIDGAAGYTRSWRSLRAMCTRCACAVQLDAMPSDLAKDEVERMRGRGRIVFCLRSQPPASSEEAQLVGLKQKPGACVRTRSLYKTDLAAETATTDAGRRTYPGVTEGDDIDTEPACRLAPNWTPGLASVRPPWLKKLPKELRANEQREIDAPGS